MSVGQVTRYEQNSKAQQIRNDIKARKDYQEYLTSYVDLLADFVRDSDLLITDCTYTDEEYPNRVNYGHSCVSQVADLACRANVKRLCLVHHDPDQTDAMVDAKVSRAQELIDARGARTVATAPAERSEIEL